MRGVTIITKRITKKTKMTKQTKVPQIFVCFVIFVFFVILLTAPGERLLVMDGNSVITVD